MNLILNGKKTPFTPSETLAQLLQRLGIHPHKLAVELNEAIIPANAYANTPLTDGDRIEIIQFVGGG